MIANPGYLDNLLIRFHCMEETIRLQFANPLVKNLIRPTIRKCKICMLYKQRVQEQLMGSLPAKRISISRPFTTTVLDFAVPFDIKNFSGKGIMLRFVSFSTKAIHLAAVPDMPSIGLRQGADVLRK